MVLVQKWPFFQLFFFQALSTRKIYSMIFQNEKTLFQSIKTRSSKRRTIDIFPGGLTHGFGPKMAIFLFFIFLRIIDQENLFYDILERKNAFLDYQNKKFKKSKKCHFSKRVNPWFWSKKYPLFQLFFFTQYRPRKYFL